MPILSIIITNYNKEIFLPFLFKILNEQYDSQVELVIIDDNSDDISLLEEYDKQCPFFHQVIYNTKNLGIGAVRQIGLTAATGQYITFIDGDDWVAFDYIKTIMKIISLYPDENVIQFSYLIYPTGDICNDIDDTMVWNKIYKADFLKKHNITFENERGGEDYFFNEKIRKYCQNWKIYICEKPIYVYTMVDPNSLSHTGLF